MGCGASSLVEDYEEDFKRSQAQQSAAKRRGAKKTKESRRGSSKTEAKELRRSSSTTTKDSRRASSTEANEAWKESRLASAKEARDLVESRRADALGKLPGSSRKKGNEGRRIEAQPTNSFLRDTKYQDPESWRMKKDIDEEQQIAMYKAEKARRGRGGVAGRLTQDVYAGQVASHNRESHRM